MQICSVYSCFPLAWTAEATFTPYRMGFLVPLLMGEGRERLYTGYGLSKVRTVQSSQPSLRKGTKTTTSTTTTTDFKRKLRTFKRSGYR